ncbi:MAG TPA: P-loop NTPase [Gemmatimonadota bacterium]|nr:P-loop NTPase [Gemmatimonadota bacterium]
MSIEHRTYTDLTAPDTSRMVAQVTEQHERVAARLAEVKACVAVMSGKGGVGKSLATAVLAAACARRGLDVGLLDADLVGPSAARMSGVDPSGLVVSEGGVRPVVSGDGVRVMSMDLLLEDGAPLAWREPGSESFVWRGAQERSALREFLADVQWGELDLLLVDLPPGTQRLVDLHELLPRLDGIVVLTIPSGASEAAVTRSMRMAGDRDVPILGVVENMSGYACPDCGETRPLFPGDAGSRLAARHEAPLLGRVPFDPRAAELAESGELAPLLDDTAAGGVLDAVGVAIIEAIR